MLISYSYDMFWLQTDVISSSFWWNPSNEIPNWEFKPVYCNNWNFTASPLLFVIFVRIILLWSHHLNSHSHEGKSVLGTLTKCSIWVGKSVTAINCHLLEIDANRTCRTFFFRQTKWFVIHWLLIKHNVILWN